MLEMMAGDRVECPVKHHTCGQTLYHTISDSTITLFGAHLPVQHMHPWLGILPNFVHQLMLTTFHCATGTGISHSHPHPSCIEQFGNAYKTCLLGNGKQLAIDELK